MSHRQHDSLAVRTFGLHLASCTGEEQHDVGSCCHFRCLFDESVVGFLYRRLAFEAHLTFKPLVSLSKHHFSLSLESLAYALQRSDLVESLHSCTHATLSGLFCRKGADNSYTLNAGGGNGQHVGVLQHHYRAFSHFVCSLLLLWLRCHLLVCLSLRHRFNSHTQAQQFAYTLVNHRVAHGARLH